MGVLACPIYGRYMPVAGPEQGVDWHEDGSRNTRSFAQKFRFTAMAHAAFETSRPAPFGAETVYGLVRGAESAMRLAGRAARALSARRRRAALKTQLRAFSVDMLDDLGLVGRV